MSDNTELQPKPTRPTDASSDLTGDADEPLGEPGVKALNAMKQERNDMRKQLKALQVQMKRFEGVDPDDYTSTKQQLEALEDDRLKQAGDWDSKKASLESKYTKQLQSVESELNKYRSLYEDSIINASVSSAFYESGGKKGAFQMLLPNLKNQLKVVDGEVLASNDKGEPIELKELMETSKAGIYGLLFDSSDTASGSGVKPQQGFNRNTRLNSGDLAKLTPAERIEYSRRLGN